MNLALAPDALVAGRSLRERVEAACTAAATAADAVDREGRFPHEALTALKAERLLGATVPVTLGGEGLSASQLADICFRLGQACSSTAMIFAMHQIKLLCLVRHGVDSDWRLDFLSRVASHQLLLASSTTEGGGGGAVRRSEAPIERTEGGVRLVRQASVISYGEQADAVVTTARRDADAAASDQVLAVFERDDCRLRRLGDWDATGMRGTCSHAFELEARGGPEQVLDTPYADIHAQTMTPAAHLLWGAAWAGVAAAAVEKARGHARRAARGGGSPGAGRLAEAQASLGQLRALLAGYAARFEAIKDDPTELCRLDVQAATSMLKVQASELALQACMSALRTCGLSGYRNGGEASMGRHLRDILSAPLMINNERILADLAGPSLMHRAGGDLTGSLDA